MNLNQVTLPAHDLIVSVAFYRRMGFRLIVDSPAYARFECPTGEATFSLHATADASAQGVVVYFECADLDARVDALVADGFVFERMPADERWLWREARLRDPAGNALCLYHAGENRRYPPWQVASA